MGSRSRTAAFAPPQLRAGWGALVIVALALFAYGNSFRVPFVFDDVRTINAPTAADALWMLRDDGSTAAGRPIVQFTLALNHRLGGSAVIGYHVFNVAVHVGAALLLYGIVRRTLGRERVDGAERLALAIAALWVVHPLQTESVTYIVQRAESLCGFFYLLTLYCFIRGAACADDAAADGGQRGTRSGAGWFVATIAACVIGSGCKEVIVTAPGVVLLYDRTFLAGSFRAAWRARGWVYVGLAASWVVLAFFVAHSGDRAGSAGFGAGVTWWQYACTQLSAIPHYLWLAVWPVRLVFDYGNHVAPNLASVALPALVVLGLAVTTVFAWMRRPAIGFLGTTFFLVLAPSSSVVPVVTQTMAEHRMYLPLAAVVSAAALGLHAAFGARSRWILAALVFVATMLTLRRNSDYASPIMLWADTAAKVPDNSRAQYNLGIAQLEAGRTAEAATSFATAVRVQPDYALARDALGATLVALGRTDEGIGELERTVRQQPNFATAHFDLAGAYRQAGRNAAARSEYEAALKLEPDAADAHFNLATLLSADGEADAAIAHYETALRARPDWTDARFGLGNTLARSNRLEEALAVYEALVRDRPSDARARTNLGNVYLLLGRAAEAVNAYEAALRLDPADENARSYLEQARAMQRGTAEVAQ